MGFTISVAIAFLGLLTLASTKPIMVTFGTNQGPIAPPQKLVSLTPRTIVARSPAPVSERTEDVPNPSTYRPMPPHQYRTKLYSYKPPPNLALGTPIDQKFTPAINDYYPEQRGSSVGVDYTGPHVFESQEYELLEAAKKLKTTLQPSVSYIKPHYYQNKFDYDRRQNFVPQIGVIYSSGVRYYIPQLNYYNKQQEQPQPQEPNYSSEEDNSVYDRNDFYYHKV